MFEIQFEPGKNLDIIGVNQDSKVYKISGTTLVGQIYDSPDELNALSYGPDGTFFVVAGKNGYINVINSTSSSSNIYTHQAFFQ